MSLKNLTSPTQTKSFKTSKSKYDLETCRICLTQVSSQRRKIDLKEPLHKGDDKLLVFEALEDVMGDKIIKLEPYSTCICIICHGLLKIAYNLKEQYYKSKKDLMSKISTFEDFHFYERHKTKKERINQKQLAGKKSKNDLEPSVDLVLGDHTYSINELLVVEDPPEATENDYTGFFNNLGTSISASFIKKNGSKLPISVKNKSNEKLKILLLGTSQNESDQVFDSIRNHDPVIPIFTCPFCRKSYKSQDYFSKHVAICEKFSKKKCYVCDKQLHSLAKLLKHMQSVHSLGKNIEPPKSKVNVPPNATYMCDACGTIMGNRRNLICHITQFHKEGKRFTCEKCGKMFYTAYKLKAHQQIHDKSEVVEVCSICAKTFHYRRALESHMLVHTQDYKHKCKFCGKKFVHKFTLTTHERIHTGEKPYSCSFCERTFCRYSQLRIHKRTIHTGERAHHCTVCDKTFVLKNKLKLHMFRHKGPFECPLCLRGFVSKEVLSYHEKKVHKSTERGTNNDQESLEEIEDQNEKEFVENLTEESSQGSDEGEGS